MKLNTFKTSALALAVFALVATSAQAQTYNDGDVYLGFDQTGVSNDYVVDLGQVSQFTTTTATFTLSTGSLATDLSSGSLFGASWHSTALWGAAAANSNTDEVWASKATSTPWADSGDQSEAYNSVETLGGANQAASGHGGYIQATSLSSSWAAFESTANGGTGAQSATGSLETYFQPGIMTGVGNILYLDDMVEGSSNPGTELGYFQINGSGAITFTGADASVPEPSTYALMILGGLLMLVLKFHRRSNNA